MKYLAVLGRQPLISVAELEAVFGEVENLEDGLAVFETEMAPEIGRLGGTQKIATKIEAPLREFLEKLPAGGKITLGVSDFSRGATAFRAQGEALKLKRLLTKMGKSVRVVPNKAAVLSSATSWHNRLFGETKIELIKRGKDFYRVIAVQDIDAYVKRDQARPARDARVGMLPPKLAQILINLCGSLPAGTRVLDPFCGTGVVLQEAELMGYVPYGTDVSERMVEYTKRNLEWLIGHSCTVSSSVSLSSSKESDPAQPGNNSRTVHERPAKPFQVSQGDATNFIWEQPIAAVACETYLGPPMSNPPAEMKLKAAKQECKAIILGFLKNLAGQIKPGTPVVIAVPAWLRPDGCYERLNLLDEIEDLSYNVKSFRNLEQEDLLYHRDRQVVAREIIVLRKK